MWFLCMFMEFTEFTLFIVGDQDPPVVVAPSQFTRINAGTFLKLAYKRFGWMDKVCRLLFTLRKIHLQKDALATKYGHVVEILEYLETNSVFDPGAAMDMMIDLDSLYDVLAFLKTALTQLGERKSDQSTGMGT